MIIGQIVNGLVVGCMYAIVALGYTLVLGVLHRLNFAQGAVFMVGGFVGLMMARLGLDFWPALIGSLLAGGALGLLTERISFRRFGSDESGITASLSSLAVGLLLTDLVFHQWGADPVTLPIAQEFSRGGITLLGIRFIPVQGLILIVTLLMLLALHFGLSRSRMGRSIRAVADSPGNSAYLGVNVKRVTQQVFFISSGLATAAGLLFAMRIGTANSDVGLAFGLKAMAVMAIGGMGDVRGAVVGGLLVGVAEGIGTHFGLGRLTELIVWLLMIVILLVRPQGLFGSPYHGTVQRA